MDDRHRDLPESSGSQMRPRGASPTSGSDKVQPRAPQKSLSCAECRRLKLRCDREVPCSNCVKRHCAELCPNEVKTTRRSGGLTAQAADQMHKRLAMLEDLLAQNGVDLGPDGQPINSMERPSSSHSARGRPDMKRQRTESLSQGLDSPVNPRRTSYPTPVQFDYSLTGIQSPEVESHGRLSNSSVRYSNPGSVRMPPPSPIPQSHGTLVLDQSGNSRYLGPTAGTEWLKNEVDGIEPTTLSRGTSAPATSIEDVQRNAAASFPFSQGPALSYEELLSKIPSPEDASVLVDSYYRYFTWNHDVAPRRSMQPLLDRILRPSPRDPRMLSKSIHPQQLALVYMILAMGSLYNLELPQHDPQAEEFLSLSKACLSRGDFLNHNTIAGVQTILIMGHFHLETEKGRNGNQAWPLWGLAMRIIVAMGLHRDGGRWDLPFEVVDERRQVFWEAHTIEVFQGNCFSRPSCLVPRYIDTAFPAPYPPPTEACPKAYKTLKYEICQMSAKILDMGMGVAPAPYSEVHEMHMQICDFERRIPFHFRCRSALCALPSLYPDPSVALVESPEPNRRQLSQTLQQFTLSLNVSENILYLQRPYFVMAMHDQPVDPTRSIYGHSYLAVVERCNVIIQIVSGLYDLHPTIAVRHWFFWYHLFTAAVCVGTLILRHPQSVLAPFALSQINQAIGLFASVLNHNPAPSMMQNHEWLVRLRTRALAKMNKESKNPTAEHTPTSASAEGEEDVELLGWRTRLIQQAGAGTHRATNIPPKPLSIGPLTHYPSVGPSSSEPAAGAPSPFLAPAVQQVLQQHLDFSLDAGSFADQSVLEPSKTQDSSTDLLLHQYWDPMIFSDSRTDQGPLPSTNWWSWDNLGMQSDRQENGH